MKRIFTKALCLVCAGALALSLAACGGKADSAASSTASSSALGSASDYDYQNFNYSDGLDEKGYWEGIRALDYVTLPEDFASVAIKRSDVEPTSEEVEAQISDLLNQYSSTEHITDRAAADGDTVNINYVGSVNNVEFTGGSAENYDLTLGSGTFIDGFEDQIIGHKPGETFDVEVTFPDPYENNPDLAGKDAVFEVTINYIEGEDVTPEFNDDFVKENLTASYGWESADDVRDSIREDLRQSQIFQFIWNYMIENSTVSEVPQAVLDFQSGAMLNQLKSQASMYGIDSATFLQAMGVASEEAFLEQYAEDIKSSATQLLIIQAIAEDAKLKADDAALAKYFSDNMGTEDYSTYEEHFGRPYVSMVVLSELANNYLMDNAVNA